MYSGSVSGGVKIRDSKLPKLELVEKMRESATGKHPILFVHGAGHGAWCWRSWMELAAESGYPAYAVSLRGHAGSEGSLLKSNLAGYVNDVVRTAASLPKQTIIVGHSLGGLVVQRTIARYAAKAAVLVAPIPARPGVGTLLSIARQNPLDAAKILVGGSLPMRHEYLFKGDGPADVEKYLAQTGNESPLAQFQVLLHKPSPMPRGGAPVLLLGTPDDNLIPRADDKDTSDPWRYRVYVGFDPTGGVNWQAVSDWRELPWDTYYRAPDRGRSGATGRR